MIRRRPGHHGVSACLATVGRGVAVVAITPWLVLVMLGFAIRAGAQESARYVVQKRPRKGVRGARAGPGAALQTHPPPTKEHFRITLSTMLLRQCWEQLVSRTEEGMLLVGVMPIAGESVASVVLPVAYRHTTRSGVSVSPASSHTQLQMLDSHHLQLGLVLHNHPGIGVDSVLESSTDRDAQERYERAGYRTLTGIVTRTHFRVFTNHLPFTLTLHGSHVQEIGDGLYKLDFETSHRVPLPKVRPAQGDGRESL